MKKVTIPCDCGCSVMMVAELPEFKDESQSYFAEFYTMVRPPFRERLKVAWQVFRGQENWIHDLCLDPEALRQLRDFLNETLD